MPGPKRRSGDTGRGPGGRRGGERSGPDRRTPPPDATGREAGYLARRKENRSELEFHLVSGETVCGVIEYYDREMIKVTRPAGPNLFIRKQEIRYIVG